MCLSRSAKGLWVQQKRKYFTGISASAYALVLVVAELLGKERAVGQIRYLSLVQSTGDSACSHESKGWSCHLWELQKQFPKLLSYSSGKALSDFIADAIARDLIVSEYTHCCAGS